MLVLLVFISGCTSHSFLLDPQHILPMHYTTDSLLNNLAPLYWVLHQAPRQNWKRIHKEDILVLKMDVSKLIANQVVCVIISAMCVAFVSVMLSRPGLMLLFNRVILTTCLPSSLWFLLPWNVNYLPKQRNCDPNHHLNQLPVNLMISFCIYTLYCDQHLYFGCLGRLFLTWAPRFVLPSPRIVSL